MFLDFLYRWCSNEKNAVVLAGYACQNTTAHELQGNKQTHKKEDGREIPVKCEFISLLPFVLLFYSTMLISIESCASLDN
jgi:Cft2 family RNA processing exonuclease